jgi:hypothetical protein
MKTGEFIIFSKSQVLMLLAEAYADKLRKDIDSGAYISNMMNGSISYPPHLLYLSNSDIRIEYAEHLAEKIAEKSADSVKGVLMYEDKRSGDDLGESSDGVIYGMSVLDIYDCDHIHKLTLDNEDHTGFISINTLDIN